MSLTLSDSQQGVSFLVAVVQSQSHIWLFVAPWTAYSTPGFCPSLSPKVCSNSCPLSWWEPLVISSSVAHFSTCPQTFPESGSFPTRSAFHIRWPKYCSLNFSISPSNEYSGLISFRIHWFYLLPVQWTLKSLVWHHSLKASILQHSAFFMIQLSCLYVTTRKP